VNIVMMAALAY